MATVLELSNTVETVDFISGDYRLLADDALQLPVPEPKRVFGGDALLSKGEGSRLIEREYQNREISIDFSIEGADHDTWVEDIRRINRILNDAKLFNTRGYGNKVTLKFQVESATDAVYFDILDGELEIPKVASAPLRRESKTTENHLTLIAKPLAHATSTLKLDNWLINGNFSSDIYEDAAAMYQFGATGWRFERADTDNLQPSAGAPPELFVGAWVKPTSSPSGIGDEYIIASAGDDASDAAWVLALRKVDAGLPRQLVFKIYESDGTLHEVVENDPSLTIPMGGGFSTYVAASVSKTLFGTGLTIPFTIPARIPSPGSYRRIELFINGRPGTSVTNVAIPDTRQATGKFGVGAYPDNTSRFVGRISGLTVIIGTVEGYRQQFLARYGIAGPAKSSNSIQNRYFWDLPSSMWGAVWDFSLDGSDVDDLGPRNLDLTVVGAMGSALMPEPYTFSGWDVRAAQMGSGSVQLITPVKYGILSQLVKVTVPGATRYIEQTWSIPISRRSTSQKWTLVFWVYGRTAAKLIMDVVYGAIASPTTGNVTATLNEWKQFIVTFAGEGATDTGTLRFGKLSGDECDVAIDGAQIHEGEPYGSFGSLTAVTGASKPYIGSRMCAMPDETITVSRSSKLNALEVRDLPGDQPAAVKLFIRNTDANTPNMGPIRVGLVSGVEPYKVFLRHPAALMLPRNDVSRAVVTSVGQSPQQRRICMTKALGDFSATGFEEVLYGILGNLFPFLNDQRGGFRILADLFVDDVEYTGDLYARATGIFEFTRDPPNQNSGHQKFIRQDVGLLYWSPIYAQTKFSAGEVGSRRTSAESESTTKLGLELYPSAAVPAASDLVVGALHLLPVEDGYYGLFPDVGKKNYLEPDSILVIDSIDREASYIVDESAFFELGDEFDETLTLGLEATSSLNAVGGGFSLVPQDKNLFVFYVEKTDDDQLYGESASGLEFEAWIEYEAKYLYV